MMVTRTVSTFRQENHPLLYISVPGNYKIDVRENLPTHVSETHYAIHFCKFGPTNEQLLSRVYYA